MTTDSQVKQIYKYLQTHKKGLTGIDALNKFGCFRLPSRICDIERKYLCEISRTWVEITDADGDTKRVKRYYIG